MSSRTFTIADRLIRAGAGAGKTTELVASFFRVVERFRAAHSRFPKIVITTFTRKATQELRERLFAEAVTRGDYEMIDYLGKKSFVHISTIHGILNVFLLENCAKVKMSADLKLVDSSQTTLAEKKVLRKVLLDDEKYSALLVEYKFDELLQACKSYYQAWLQNENIAPVGADLLASLLQKELDHIKSEALEAAKQILESTESKSWVEYAGVLNLFVGASDAATLTEKIESYVSLVSRKPSYNKKNPPFDEQLSLKVEALHDLIKDFQKDYACKPEYIQKHNSFNLMFADMAREFSQKLWAQKQESSEIEMAEIELIAYRLIQENPSIAEAFSKNWDYWMIDEYQDTSPVQVALLDNLVGDRPSFVVGDPQQSIYLFRGARSQVFDEREQKFLQEGKSTELKMVNYRSQGDVLSYINDYFVSMDSNAFAAMEIDPKKQVQDSKTPAIFHYVASKDAEISQSEVIYFRVHELLSAGAAPQDIAIVSRTKKTLRDIEEYLESRNVDVQLHAGGGFYHRDEIVDSILFLKFVLNPHDNLNFVGLLRSGWLKLTDLEISKIPMHNHTSFWLQSETKLPVACRDQLLAWLACAKSSGLSAAYKLFLQSSDILNSAMKMDPSGGRQANLWKFLALLTQQESKPGFNGLKFLEAEIQKASVESGGDSDAVPAIEPQRVNLMTIHASKGLQFEHVIIPDMHSSPRKSNAKMFNTSESKDYFSLSVRSEEDASWAHSLWTSKQLEQYQAWEDAEVNRNLYVAMTRAKRSLTLTYMDKIMKGSWAYRSNRTMALSVGLNHFDTFTVLKKNSDFGAEAVTKSSAASKQLREAFQFKVEQEPTKESVTGQLEKELDKNAPASPDGLDQALLRASRGTEAHAIFESLRYQSVDEILSGISDTSLQEAVCFIRDCKEPALLELIVNGQVEWGFALKDKERSVQGQVDLWCLHQGQLFVVDYKTGSEKYSETAFKQLAAYAGAIKKVKALQIDSAELLVVYPFTKKTLQRRIQI